MAKRVTALVQSLEMAKRSYGPACAVKCEQVLRRLKGVQFGDASTLIRAHDTLLFLRAFPQSAKVARLADSLLGGLELQVTHLLETTGDTEAFDDEAVSGIAGTTVTNALTFDLVRQLALRHGRQLTAEWNVDEHYRQMGLTLPTVLPLLDDDSFVEADTPYLKWIEAASKRSQSSLSWLLDNFAGIDVPSVLRTSLFSGLGINIAWNLHNSPASRTLARKPVKKLFCHNEPLLQRKDVSIARVLAAPPLSLHRLSRKEGRAILDMVQDAVTVRYRELQGTTYADPDTVLHCDVGRGVQLYLWGLLPGWRLPLRSYYAGFAVKNGVPINYFEAIGLFEWMEIGFNTFYAYREGETAWIYAQYLHLLHHVAGTTCFSVYPYQIGQDNEEAIKSGAFWFYRKLGFRPGRPDLLALTLAEEKKMARDPKHRSSLQTLRRLAEGHIFFEIGERPQGAWDSFSTRTLGLAVQDRLAPEFGGEAWDLRCRSTAHLAKALGVNIGRWKPTEQQAFSNFALVLSLVPEVADWPIRDKRKLLVIIRAKTSPDETKYIRLLQQHESLRAAFLRVGSATSY
ncbi:MAG TPA: hypothetical protein VFB24_10485 [Candidatus Binatia bacterium]|nr:hypothetical protein [Candidatus Binatia bacterium]